MAFLDFLPLQAQNKEGMMPLLCAAEAGDIECITSLVEMKANITAKSSMVTPCFEHATLALNVKLISTLPFYWRTNRVALRLPFSSLPLTI